MKAPQKSLKKWTQQKWRTKSGKKSSETGERYLPEKAIKSLSPAEYAATTKAKREGTAKGKQFVKQPEKIAEKTAKFRASKGGVAMNKKPMNEGMKALKKEAPEVAKKMGYMGGGMTKKTGYAKGGMVKANCGASMKPNRMARK